MIGHCLFLLSVLGVPAVVHASMSIETTTACFPDADPPICSGQMTLEGPLPEAPDEWIAYQWLYVKGLAPECTIRNVDTEGISSTIDLRVNHTDSTCMIAWNQQSCSSCSVCNLGSGYLKLDEVISSDCTNLEGGRIVECESVAPFYFPMEATGAAEQPCAVDPTMAPTIMSDSTVSNRLVGAAVSLMVASAVSVFW